MFCRLYREEAYREGRERVLGSIPSRFLTGRRLAQRSTHILCTGGRTSTGKGNISMAEKKQFEVMLSIRVEAEDSAAAFADVRSHYCVVNDPKRVILSPPHDIVRRRSGELRLMITIADLKPGYLYRLHSRNLRMGVYQPEMYGKPGFIGIRNKFGNRFLDVETHYDACEHYGTAKPTEELAVCPLSDQRNDLGTVCGTCKGPIAYLPYPDGPRTKTYKSGDKEWTSCILADSVGHRKRPIRME